VALGLWCKVTIDKAEAEDRGYDRGFDEGVLIAQSAMGYVEKRMEGK
jgi:hypothetical protein